jgi:predicted glycosyltransferase
MNREAAALGVPAATIYAGRWAAVDEELCRVGKLTRLTSAKDFALLPLAKKPFLNPPVTAKARQEVIDLILGDG